MRSVLQGEVYWLRLPREGQGAAPHPYVVVQDDVFNRSRVHSVVVCAISSNRKRFHEPGNVVLEIGEAGLERPSAVIVSQIDAVDRERFGERLGQLDPRRVRQVLAGLAFVQRLQR